MCLDGVGCALFRQDGPGNSRSANRPLSPSDERASVLPAIAPPGGSIQLEIYFVERPVSDPLLGPRLWQEVDQMASLPSQMRESLQQHGFRLGVTGSTPPQALQIMLGLAEELPGDSETEASNQLVGRRVTLRPGAETEIQTSPYYQRCTVSIPNGRDAAPKELENVRFLFRVTVHRVQDGWARLDFLPEIHHGAQIPRRIATEGGWQLKSSQDIEPLFGQRFSITLNLGEMVVLTAEDPEAISLGRDFFVGPQKHPADVQRLVVVRLANVIQKGSG